MRHLELRAVLVLSTLAGLISPAIRADAQTASNSDPVNTEAISVPKGEGSLEGMGESFSAQPSTGIATFSLPIQIPKARGGAQAALVLDYRSSAGAGIAGQGWSLGAPSIARQTDRGNPRYNDPAGGSYSLNQDRFVFGGQELVPLGVVVGGACAGAPGESFPPWANGWQYFRTRVEGSFVRFFWSPDHRTWRTFDKQGISQEFGVPLDGSGRTDAVEASPTSANSIFRWNLARTYDDEGPVAPLSQASPTPVNLVVYQYTQAGSIAFLSDIYHTPPSQGASAAPTASYAHHVHLVYEDRTDPTFSFRRGWQTQMTRRLSRVDVSSQTLAASGPRELVRRYLLGYEPNRRTSLLATVSEEGRCAAPVQEDAGGLLPYARSCPAMPPTKFAYSQGGRPGVTPVTLPNLGTFDTTVVPIVGGPVIPMSDPTTDFLDVDGDSLPDILRTAASGSGHQVYFNGRSTTAGTFGAAAQMNVATGSPIGISALQFGQQVITLDADGDAIVDLVYMPNSPNAYIASSGQSSGAWQWLVRNMLPPSDASGPLNLSSSRPNVRVMDVNGDGLVDIVESTSQMRTYFNLGRYPGGDGHFGSATWTTATTASLSNTAVVSCLPGDNQAVQLSQAPIQTVDMNGDGLVDIVRLISGSVQYWPGRGDGTWGVVPPLNCPGTTRPAGSQSQIAMANAPTFSQSGGEQQRLTDLNHDGFADLIDVLPGAVNVYFNLGGTAFAATPLKIAGTPNASQPVVRIVDIDGSGTRDIVWGHQNDYRYLDVLGGGRPNLLTHIDNGLGKTTDLTYSTSSAMMTAAAKAGQPWSATMPISCLVVASVVESDNLPVAGRPANTYETDYTYRDPVWAPQQREFRGFSQVSTRKTGDASTPPSTTWTSYLTGDCVDETNDAVGDCSPSGRWHDNPREALKGLSVASETFDDHGVYLATKHTTYTLRQLFAGLDGRSVRHAFARATDAWLYDTSAFTPAQTPASLADVVLEGGAQGAVPTSALKLRSSAGRAHVQTARVVDGVGNVTTTSKLGCVDGCPEIDEPVSAKAEFAIAPGDASGWIYRPVHGWTEGGATGRRKEMLVDYDDRGHVRVTRAVLSGSLPLRRFHEAPQVALGVDGGAPLVAPAPSNASSDGTIVLSSRDIDALGNVTFVREANNHCRTFAYDAAFASLPVTESIYAGALGADRASSGSVASAAFASSAGGTACGTTVLSAVAVYDRGLVKPTLITEIHGETTLLQYDGLGRLAAYSRPDPRILGAPEGTPSVIVSYDLDPTGARRYSLIHTTSTSGASSGGASVGAREAWAYVDGLGRKVVTLEQADPAAGDVKPWVVQGLTHYDLRGHARDVYLPWFSDQSPSAYPLGVAPATAFTEHQFDAFDREWRTLDTSGGVAKELHFHALSTDTWDAEDLKTGGPHAGTFTTQRKDGLGREVSQIERLHVGAALVASETTSRYLPTGERVQITRAGGSVAPLMRWMAYDSLGRMVQNVDPHATKGFAAPPGNGSMIPLVYAYDDAGELVGTSDARGCGVNYTYDGAGRGVSQDYSPCLDAQPAYTAPDLATGNGTEVYQRYDEADPDAPPECAQDPALLLGRLTATSDRGGHLVTGYDARGRVACTARKVSKPGDPDPTLANRYASNWFVQHTAFDDADRVIAQTTGAESPELLGQDGTSAATATYTGRGLVAVAGSSYGALVNSVLRDASGLIQQIQYGDLARTTTAFTFDARQRVQTVSTRRGAPALWSGTGTATAAYEAPASPGTTQTTLEDLSYAYDDAGNPIAIQDLRDPSAWPAGAAPVSRTIGYDDLYRATDVAYQYVTTEPDAWVDPFDAEDRRIDGDSRRASPAPHLAFDHRVGHQTFAYDALGNTTSTGDDARGFYDRSLGAITNAPGKPYQIAAASNELGQGGNEGHLSTAYDDAGNMVGLAILRAGACLPQGAVCAQRVAYDWDEVGNLSRARRWDVAGDPGSPEGQLPSAIPAVDLKYIYDSSGLRVVKTATDDLSGSTRHAVYPMVSLELRGASFDGATYARTALTEVPYLFAHGVRLGRVAYAMDDVPTVASGKLHVYLELPDQLGSTSLVIDHDTSELVEAATYQVYGGVDSDYRPERWRSFREDHRFTGKEEDVEVGLVYFGKRYYAPGLGRWISADPLAVAVPGRADLNLYAYVFGRVLNATDPVGLELPIAGAPAPDNPPDYTPPATSPTGDFVDGAEAGARNAAIDTAQGLVSMGAQALPVPEVLKPLVQPLVQEHIVGPINQKLDTFKVAPPKSDAGGVGYFAGYAGFNAATFFLPGAAMKLAAPALMLEEGALNGARVVIKTPSLELAGQDAALGASRINSGNAAVRGINCPFCTAGGSSTPQVTSSQVAAMTGMTEGPLQLPQAGQLFSGMGLGNGTYQTFADYQAASQFMRAQPAGTRFGVAYMNPGAPYGHVITGQNTMIGVIFRDFQASGLPWIRPQGALPSASFWIFTF